MIPPDLNVSSRQQIIPSGNSSTVTSNTVASTNSVTSPPTTTGKIQMPPPPPPLGDGAVPSAAVMLDSDLTKSKKHLTHSPGSTAGRSTTTISDSCPLAPHPGGVTTSSGGDDNSGSYEYHLEGKKLQKRAANRRSAQLSRKRKKQFMEDLKEENDDLRRKEQILKSIPDLILVFDSTGKLWFVSKSVSRLLSYRADELEGTSIWDRMCEDSVRLLKAAFMDSLAARQPDSETAPLGSGFWELRLVDKDGGHKIVTLNGVVHFAGERPECVCSIRPREDVVMKKKSSASSGQKGKTASEMQSGDDDDDEDDEDESDEKEDDDHHRSLIRVKPQQSVICADRHMLKRASGGKGRDAVRISDSGNSSGESESASGSGSSDELNGTSGSS
jgi:PAS domain S-box-containing protein